MSVWLPRTDEYASPVMASDCEGRPCARCGYDLRGLPMTGVCPECGEPKSSARRGISGEPLSRMPVDLIRAFRLGAWLSAGALMAAVALLLATIVYGSAMGGLGLAWPAVAGLWLMGVWLVTPARPERDAARRGFAENDPLRHLARWLQVAWLGVAALLTAGALAPAGAIAGPMLGFGLLLTLPIALVGLGCFLVLMERLADWACDHGASNGFNYANWGIMAGALAIGTLIIVANVGSLPGIALLLLGAFATLVLLAGLGFLFWSTMSLARSVNLCISHAHEYEAMERRRRERLREHFDEVNAPHLGRTSAAGPG